MMGSKSRVLFICGICILLFSSCGQKKNNTEKIIIAVAANMQFAAKALTKEFTKLYGVDCDLVISSSGNLTAQIKEGAPYSIFLSANMKYPNEIFKSGHAHSPPDIYAYGKLVLWSMVDELIPSIESITDESIDHIAIANPKIAPYGQAAIEVLNHYGIFREVENKLVYGESIAQTNQFIVSESAEIGFTALSVVLSSKMEKRGQWIEIDQKFHPPIEQGVVLIKQKKKEDPNAIMFYDFLFSAEAKKILKDFGYSVNE